MSPLTLGVPVQPFLCRSVSVARKSLTSLMCRFHVLVDVSVVPVARNPLISLICRFCAGCVCVSPHTPHTLRATFGDGASVMVRGWGTAWGRTPTHAREQNRGVIVSGHKLRCCRGCGGKSGWRSLRLVQRAMAGVRASGSGPM
jgi:hypothetical protein